MDWAQPSGLSAVRQSGRRVRDWESEGTRGGAVREPCTGGGASGTRRCWRSDAWLGGEIMNVDSHLPRLRLY